MIVFEMRIFIKRLVSLARHLVFVPLVLAICTATSPHVLADRFNFDGDFSAELCDRPVDGSTQQSMRKLIA
jgi:hypothetical protein